MLIEKSYDAVKDAKLMGVVMKVDIGQTLPVPLIVGFSKAFEICQSSRNEELEKLKFLEIGFIVE